MKRTILMTGAAAVAALALAACGANNNPTAPAGGGGGSTASAGGGGSITVGSADFSESQVLGEIYAGAIKAKGITVTTKPNIGSRDVYIKALQDGSIDIVPEYTGSLLTFLKGTAPTQDPDAVYTALKSTLPPTLVVLDKSTAEDKNSIVVTKDTQSKYSLKSIADLTAHQAEITVAAPPEFQHPSAGPGRAEGAVRLHAGQLPPAQGCGDRQRPDQRPGRRRPTSSAPTRRSRRTGSSRWRTRSCCSAPTTSCR